MFLLDKHFLAIDNVETLGGLADATTHEVIDGSLGVLIAFHVDNAGGLAQFNLIGIDHLASSRVNEQGNDLHLVYILDDGLTACVQGIGQVERVLQLDGNVGRGSGNGVIRASRLLRGQYGHIVEHQTVDGRFALGEDVHILGITQTAVSIVVALSPCSIGQAVSCYDVLNGVFSVGQVVWEGNFCGDVDR